MIILEIHGKSRVGQQIMGAESSPDVRGVSCNIATGLVDICISGSMCFLIKSVFTTVA
jgi:hypothetical protein